MSPDTALERERLIETEARLPRHRVTIGVVALATAVAALVLLPIVGLIALQHQGCEARLKSYGDRLVIIEAFSAKRTYPPTSDPDVLALEQNANANRASLRVTLLKTLGPEPHC